MAHPKCTRSVENLVMEQLTCGKGPKLGFEYLPTYKTLHCGRTAGALRARHSHGLCDHLAHFWAPKTVGIRWPFLILIRALSIGYPREGRGYAAIVQIWPPETAWVISPFCLDLSHFPVSRCVDVSQVVYSASQIPLKCKWSTEK